MVVYVRSLETPTEVILEWAGIEGDSITNHQGVQSSHVTEVVEGSARLEIEGQRPRTMNPGESIILPTNTRYTFTVLRAGRMHCHYRKDVAGQVEEISHLRTGQPIRMSL
jgi:quercetin dioxygenase-like cupin family protein